MIRRFPSGVRYDGSADDAPVAKLWYGILSDSLKRGCKQIHLFLSDLPSPPVLIRPGPFEEIDELLADEPLPEPGRTPVVRVYVNDAWEDMMTLPAPMYGACIQRLKVMASFSLARRPSVEQGRFHFEVRGAVYEIAVTVRVRPDGSQEAMVDLPTAPVEKVGQVS
jgi:hypothetical protein